MTEKRKEDKIETPGTLVLVFIFLTWLLAWFTVAWVLLSRVWPVS